MKASELLDRLADDLNDNAPGYEFVSWNKQQLLFYIKEGLQIAFNSRSDLFSELLVHKVTPCSPVQEGCNCEQITRIYGQATENGRVLKPLKRKKSLDEITWTGRTCTSRTKGFELTHYYMDKSASNRFWVFPPAPPGEDVYVLIECAMPPTDLSGDFNIKAEIEPAVYQWVLYRALAIDAENNPTISQIAENHKQTCFSLLLMEQQAKDKQKAEAANVGKPDSV